MKLIGFLVAVLLCTCDGAVASQMVLYADGVADGVHTWSSWGTDGYLLLSDSQPPVHAGAAAILLTGANYNGLAFSWDRPVTAQEYPFVHLWVHGDGHALQQFRVDVSLDGVRLGSVMLDDYLAGGYIAKDQWRHLSIPLEELPFAVSGFNQISVASLLANEQPAIRIDDVVIDDEPEATETTDKIFADTFGAAHWVDAYYVGYEAALDPVDEIDFEGVTHLMIGHANPRNDGTLNTAFDIDPLLGPHWAKLAALVAHEHQAKAIIMIGGSDQSGWFGAVAAGDRFVDALLDLVDELHADGLDLDWEPLDANARAPLLALVKALKARRPNLLVTVPVGWVNRNIAPTTDPYWAQLAASVDHFNIMTYDMAGAWGEWTTWHSSALSGEFGSGPSSVASSVEYYSGLGVPKEKIGIGVPFYGTCWRGATGPRQIIPSDGSVATIPHSDGVMSYRNLVAYYYDAGIYAWDDEAFVPYLASTQPMGPAQCNFISFEDAHSIGLKGDYIRENGLGGAILWTLGQGHLPPDIGGPRDPLLEALRIHLRPTF